MSYRAPVSDVLLAMKTTGRLNADLYPTFSLDDASAILEEAGRFAAEQIAPLNWLGDQKGSRVVDGGVLTPESWPSTYRAWCDAGWNSLTGHEEHGGQGLPMIMAVACTELWNAAALSFALIPLLTTGAIEAIAAHANEELKARYLPKMIQGVWTGTMNLTEPQSGSDLSGIRCKAQRSSDGSYWITGSKIYITYGEHDCAENIIHLVLARLPDAPEGTRGISLFLVPKVLPDGTRNDLRCHSIEHKLGIKASPTCTMNYGDNGGAQGWLIGEENRGLTCMFTMMNNARLLVGVQGVGLAERATQAALAHARQRKQGRAVGVSSGQSAIIAHADVRRMILEMQSKTCAARLLCMATASAIDEAQQATDASQKAKANARASLLTPLAKSYSTDIAVEVASLGVQVHGGMGFIEETGVAQFYRDARILPIYEGTNGIQATDLVTRKIGLEGGATLQRELQACSAQAEKWETVFGASMVSRLLQNAVSALQDAAQKIAALELDRALAVAVPFQRALSATLAAGHLMDVAIETKDTSICNFFVLSELAGVASFCEAIGPLSESIVRLPEA
jgi:acyl-CoA dehydrogenase